MCTGLAQVCAVTDFMSAEKPEAEAAKHCTLILLLDVHFICIIYSASEQDTRRSVKA
jgi:hypothetical protein